MYFYPTLTDELKEAAGIENVQYTYSYMIDGIEHKLLPKGKSTVRIDDEDWKIERDGLRIRKKILLEYPEMLYGPNGIACKGAELGVCIVWVNGALTQMGTILPTNEYTDEHTMCYEFDHEFEPGELKGNLELDVRIYLKRAAEHIDQDERHLINDEGVTVGTLDVTNLDFGSSYMDFPIQEISSKNQPMWWLEMGDWSDPTKEFFDDDSICIYLNTSYESCPRLGEKIRNEDVLIDIITTAYVMIYNRIEELGYLQQTLNDIGLEPGSISKIMFYFKDSCENEIDFSTPEHMHKTIWMNVLSMLSGGEEQ